MKESQQKMAVEELKASRRPCAIVNEEQAAFYLKGLPPPSTPLVHYVKKNFEPDEVGRDVYLRAAEAVGDCTW